MPAASPNRSPLRVLLVDDDPAFLDLVSALLAKDERVEIVGRASDGAEGVELARTLRPDVVLMDLRMPRMDGFEATRRIAGGTGARVLVVSSSSDREDVDRAHQAGAAGYLRKDRAVAELLDAVEQLRPGPVPAAALRLAVAL